MGNVTYDRGAFLVDVPSDWEDRSDDRRHVWQSGDGADALIISVFPCHEAADEEQRQLLAGRLLAAWADRIAAQSGGAALLGEPTVEDQPGVHFAGVDGHDAVHGVRFSLLCIATSSQVVVVHYAHLGLDLSDLQYRERFEALAGSVRTRDLPPEV
jgi:hypothetical protein